MINILKEVGRGKRGAKDLTYEDALRAAELILQGEATPAQTGAYLVAERIKMESVDEILAFIHTLKKHAATHPIPGSIDCAGPYDGRNKTFQATIATSFVLAACGLPATLHGGSSMPPKWGTTLLDTLTLLGAPNPSTTPMEAWTQAAQQSGFMFIPTEHWCPPLSKIRGIREELGLRTVFNTAEKLLRLTESPYMVIGVFHGTVFEKMTHLLTELNIEKALVVQGSEGSEDLPADKRTRTYIVEKGLSQLYTIDPEHFGLHAEPVEKNWTKEQQAQSTIEVLQNKAEDGLRNIVLLNSGVRLWTANKAGTIEEGIEQATHALEQGAAWNTFQSWNKSISTKEIDPLTTN